MNPELLYQAAGLLLGAILGSFLATVLIRWPQGRSVIAGRSRCDACGKPLGPGDMVPILSYAALHGKCRACGVRIDRRHFAIELAAATLGLIALVAHPLPLAVITLGLGLWLLLLAMLDLEHQWLPDRLTLPLAPLGWRRPGPFRPAADGACDRRAAGWAALFRLPGLSALRGREGMGRSCCWPASAPGSARSSCRVLLGAGLCSGLAAILLTARAKGPATTRLLLGADGGSAWPIWLIVVPEAFGWLP